MLKKYLLIESRDPFECNDCMWLYETAKSLGTSGNQVTLFLLQNGVLPACVNSDYACHLSVLYAAGVKIFADNFALEARAISSSQLIDEVEPVTIDMLASLLTAPSTKAIWH